MSGLLPNKSAALLAALKERFGAAQCAALRAVNKSPFAVELKIGEFDRADLLQARWARTLCFP